jgi:hypothetical protein
MKSWSRFPSFFDRTRNFACLMTSCTSATSALPSAESLSEGLERAFDARKLFRATSICSFWGDESCQIGMRNCEGPQTTYRWDLAVLERTDDTVKLELSVHIGLLHLDVGGLVDGSHVGSIWWKDVSC